MAPAAASPRTEFTPSKTISPNLETHFQRKGRNPQGIIPVIIALQVAVDPESEDPCYEYSDKDSFHFFLLRNNLSIGAHYNKTRFI